MIALLGGAVAALGALGIWGGVSGYMAAMVAALVSPSDLSSPSGTASGKSNGSSSGSGGLNYSPGNVIHNVVGDYHILHGVYHYGSDVLGAPGAIASEIDKAARDITKIFS